MRPRCILFDVDGTLINTWDLYMEVYWRTLRDFKGDHVTKETVLAMKPTSELHFIKQNIGEDKLEDAHKIMMQYYERLHDELFGGVYTGVPELLEAIRADGCSTGIVTGKSWRAWQITSKKIRLGTFDSIVVDDNVDHPKPHPQGMRQALDDLKVLYEETLYVGDTVSDYKAARAAGIRGVLVLWAKSDQEKEKFIARARENGAKEFYEHPDELMHDLMQ